MLLDYVLTDLDKILIFECRIGIGISRADKGRAEGFIEKSRFWILNQCQIFSLYGLLICRWIGNEVVFSEAGTTHNPGSRQQHIGVP